MSSKIDDLLIRIREVQKKTLTSASCELISHSQDFINSSPPPKKKLDDFSLNASFPSHFEKDTDTSHLDVQLAAALEKLQRSCPLKTPVREWYRATVTVWDLLTQSLNRVVIPPYPTTQKTLQSIKKSFLEEISTLKSALKNLQYHQLRVLKKFTEAPKHLESLERQCQQLTTQLESTVRLLEEKNHTLEEAYEMVNILKDSMTSKETLEKNYQLECEKRIQLEKDFYSLKEKKHLLHQRVEVLETQVESFRKESTGWKQESHKKEEVIRGLEKLLQKAGESLQELEKCDADKQEQITRLMNSFHSLPPQKLHRQLTPIRTICLASKIYTSSTLGVQTVLLSQTSKVARKRTTPETLFSKTFLPLQRQFVKQLLYVFHRRPNNSVTTSTQCSASSYIQQGVLINDPNFQKEALPSCLGEKNDNETIEKQKKVILPGVVRVRQHLNLFTLNCSTCSVAKSFTTVVGQSIHAFPKLKQPFVRVWGKNIYILPKAPRCTYLKPDPMQNSKDLSEVAYHPGLSSFGTLESKELDGSDLESTVCDKSHRGSSSISSEKSSDTLKHEVSPLLQREDSINADTGSFQQCSSPPFLRTLSLNSLNHPYKTEETLTNIQPKSIKTSNIRSAGIRSPLIEQKSFSGCVSRSKVTQGVFPITRSFKEQRLSLTSESNTSALQDKFVRRENKLTDPSPIEDFLFSTACRSLRKQSHVKGERQKSTTELSNTSESYMKLKYSDRLLKRHHITHVSRDNLCIRSKNDAMLMKTDTCCIIDQSGNPQKSKTQLLFATFPKVLTDHASYATPDVNVTTQTAVSDTAQLQGDSCAQASYTSPNIKVVSREKSTEQTQLQDDELMHYLYITPDVRVTSQTNVTEKTSMQGNMSLGDLHTISEVGLTDQVSDTEKRIEKEDRLICNSHTAPEVNELNQGGITDQTKVQDDRLVVNLDTSTNVKVIPQVEMTQERETPRDSPAHSLHTTPDANVVIPGKKKDEMSSQGNHLLYELCTTSNIIVNCENDVKEKAQLKEDRLRHDSCKELSKTDAPKEEYFEAINWMNLALQTVTTGVGNPTYLVPTQSTPKESLLKSREYANTNEMLICSTTVQEKHTPKTSLQPNMKEICCEKELKELKKHYNTLLHRQYSMLDRLLLNYTLRLEKESEAEKEEMRKKYLSEQQKCAQLRSVLDRVMMERPVLNVSDVTENHASNDTIICRSEESQKSTPRTPLKTNELSHRDQTKQSTVSRSVSYVWNDTSLPLNCQNIAKESGNYSSSSLELCEMSCTKPCEKLCFTGLADCALEKVHSVTPCSRHDEKRKTSHTTREAKQLEEELMSQCFLATAKKDTTNPEAELLAKLSRVREKISHFFPSCNVYGSA